MTTRFLPLPEGSANYDKGLTAAELKELLGVPDPYTYVPPVYTPVFSFAVTFVGDHTGWTVGGGSAFYGYSGPGLITLNGVLGAAGSQSGADGFTWRLTFPDMPAALVAADYVTTVPAAARWEGGTVPLDLGYPVTVTKGGGNDFVDVSIAGLSTALPSGDSGSLVVNFLMTAPDTVQLPEF